MRFIDNSVVAYFIFGATLHMHWVVVSRLNWS